MPQATNGSLAKSLDNRVETIVTELKQVYPNATDELDWETPSVRLCVAFVYLCV
jgi:uncharacterized protein YdhG (YjbR/CyaY superfamily)